MSYWVDQLVEITAWDGSEWEFDWKSINSFLGTDLPSDFKEICERFGPGYFSSSLWIKCDDDNDSLWSWWRESVDDVERDPLVYGSLYRPYGLYGVSGNKGLLNWGASDAPGLFFWLADAEEDPNTWPVIVTDELGSDRWFTQIGGTAEFVYRMIKYPKSEIFSMGNPESSPSFRSMDPD